MVVNAIIHPVDSSGNVFGAMAIRDGKVVELGSPEELTEKYSASETVDMNGLPVFPGFIDAHCHFYGYALGLRYLDLTGTTSFEEVLEKLKGTKVNPGEWIVGRGWDQNLWKEKVFPNNRVLNERYPGNPVMLIRIDGHVVLANDNALKAAGITGPGGFDAGQVAVSNGYMTGILSESAADRMRSAVPEPRGEQLLELIAEAARNCYEVGLTTVGDAGLEYDQLMVIDSLQKSGKLALQLYAMLTPTGEIMEKVVASGPYITPDLEARAVKIYADGSLGSRTARLKMPYSDAPGESGLIVTKPDSIRRLCKIAYDKGFQVNTHCIGDSAVRMVLDIYAEFLKGKNDLRWRIEHAQVVDPADLHFFRDYSVVPSVQATHATSDMAWAPDRLGRDRAGWAYAYKDLMEQNGWIPNGTDFPIENISPFLTFYAAVARKDINGLPEGGFQAENALTRQDALQSITIWAAKANFMEKRKGSLEVGKDADFVVLDGNILEMDEADLPRTNVEKTYIKGKCVYHKDK